AAVPQLPDIPAPNFPRAFGPNTDGNSFAASQVYSANPEQATINGGNVTLTWTNPQVSAGNITSVIITYQSNLSTSEARGSILLTSSEHLIVTGTASYTWTDLAPGQYNFTIQPILGDIFFGVEVVPAILDGVIVSELSATSPTAVAVSPTTIVMANTVAEYANGITITTTVTDNDPNNGEDPTLVYTTSPAGSCSISDKVLGVFDGNGVTTATATAKVNLLNAGTTCIVTATPKKADDGAPATFRIIQEHIVPLLVVPDTATGMEGAPVEFIVTATKQDPGSVTVTFASTFNADGCTMTRIDPAMTGSSGYVSIGNTYTQVYSATRLGSGSCTIPKSSFTATEDTATANGGTGNIVISFQMAQPPLIAITAGVRRLNLPAIPDTVHEITVTATKQDATDIAEVMFTISLAAALNNEPEHCDVEITNPTASYVGDGIGSIATTNITISYSGPLSFNERCAVNVAVTEGTKTSNLPFINTFDSAIYVQFSSVNVKPLLKLSGVPTGIPFPDERPRIGVQATKQDNVGGGILSSEVRVINGACMAILDGDDISISPSFGFGRSSSIAYYRIILDAANAVSAIAAERECELDFSVTETETRDNDVPGFSDPVGTQKKTNRTVTFNFAQELPPLFASISISSGSSATSPSNRDVLVDLALNKQDASNTRDITLPDTINSVGDVCTATLRDPARYAATAIGSIATGTYAVRIDNVAISESTACGAFVFTATDGSATSTSAASASPAITFTPSVELPPSVVLNAAASTIDDLLNSETAIIAVTITKQDNAEANLVVTGVISGGSCSIRELTNTGYGSNPMTGSTATASYEVTNTPSQNIDGACTVSITATEDGSATSITQEVSFSTTPTQASFNHGRMSGLSSDPDSRVVLSLVRKEDTTPNRNVVMRITRVVASYGNGTTLPDSWCTFGPPANSATFPSATIGASHNGDFVYSRLPQSWSSRYQCAVDYSADVDGDGADSLPPATTTRIYQVTPYLGVAPSVTVSTTSSNSSVAGTPVTVNVIATRRSFFANPVVFAMDFNVSDCMITKQGDSSGSYAFVGDIATQTYSINRPTAGNCTIPNSMFTAIDVGIIGRGTGITNVVFTSSAPVVSAGPIFFGDAAPVPATLMTQR
nr:fibronectin type III domain-containing protein [Gammaproteobacteria bacterium]